MIFLASTSDQLRVTSGNSAGTTALDCQVSWIDFSGTTGTPGRTNTAIASASATSIAGSPASSTQRSVKTVSIRNTHASLSNVITIDTTDGTTTPTLIKPILQPSEVCQYIEGQGWGVLDANGNRKVFNQTALGYCLGTVQYLTSGSTYTTPTNCKALRVTCVGGGGGGGGTVTAASSAACGAGGGGGGVSQVWVIGPASSYPISVGAAGGAGSTAGGNGGNGGDTTFGSASICTGKGGLGGTGMNAASTTIAGAGAGTGGAASSGVGDIKYDGATGYPSFRMSGTVAVSGAGAPSIFGAGSNQLQAGGTGTNGGQWGAGAAGGLVLNGSAAAAGGVGATGIIVVEEFY